MKILKFLKTVLLSTVSSEGLTFSALNYEVLYRWSLQCFTGEVCSALKSVMHLRQYLHCFKSKLYSALDLQSSEVCFKTVFFKSLQCFKGKVYTLVTYFNKTFIQK